MIMLFAFIMFGCFLPNQNILLSNFWQQIPHTVGYIQANKPSFTSCLSGAFTIFYSPTWNTQYQQILAANHSARTVGAGGLLIATSMNNKVLLML